MGAAKSRAQGRPPGHLSITAVSTHADRVSGGGVLIEIVARGAAGTNAGLRAVTLGGRDLSAAFHHAGNGVYLWAGDRARRLGRTLSKSRARPGASQTNRWS